MRPQIPSGMTLKESGFILCDKCNREGDPGDRPLHVGDTYFNEPCDCCGNRLTAGILARIIPPAVSVEN